MGTIKIFSLIFFSFVFSSFFWIQNDCLNIAFSCRFIPNRLLLHIECRSECLFWHKWRMARRRRGHEGICGPPFWEPLFDTRTEFQHRIRHSAFSMKPYELGLICFLAENAHLFAFYLELTRLSVYGFLGRRFIISDSDPSYASEIAGT